jgi:hypothetical protein
MSTARGTDGPKPTQGAPKKKKKGKPVGFFFGDYFFLPCFFLFFWRPLDEVIAKYMYMPMPIGPVSGIEMSKTHMHLLFLQPAARALVTQISA